MLRLLTLALIATLASTPTDAQTWDQCDDLWFARNQILDRAGYCFGSALGQSLFDNSNCVTKTPELNALELRKVEMARALEQILDCKVDTTQHSLPISLLGLRLALEDIPVISEYASGCLRWGGAPIELRAGHRDNAPVFGSVHPGEDIVWEYETPGAPEGWEFITVYLDGVQIMLGWSNTPVDYEKCGGLAG